jgi:hypothetical protein
MVVSCKMQHAVKDQYFDFSQQIVANLGRLSARRLQGDGNIAASQLWLRRKGEHVGWFVLAAELQIQALHFRVAGEQDIHLTVESGGTLSLVGETGQGQAAQVFRFSSF